MNNLLRNTRLLLCIYLTSPIGLHAGFARRVVMAAQKTLNEHRRIVVKAGAASATKIGSNFQKRFVALAALGFGLESLSPSNNTEPETARPNSSDDEITPEHMLQHPASETLEQMSSDIKIWRQKQTLMEQAIERDIKKIRSIKNPNKQQQHALQLAKKYEDLATKRKKSYENFVLNRDGNNMLHLYIWQETSRNFCNQELAFCKDFSESAPLIKEYEELTDDLETRQLGLASDLSKNIRPTLQAIYESQFKEENVGKVKNFSFHRSIDLQSSIPITLLTLNRAKILPLEGAEFWGHLSKEKGAYLAMMPFWSQSSAFAVSLWQHKEAGYIIQFILKHESAHMDKLHTQCNNRNKHHEELEADQYAIQGSKMLQYGGMCYFNTALLYTFLRSIYSAFKTVNYPDKEDDRTKLALYKGSENVLAQESPSHPKLIDRFLKCAEGTSNHVRLNSVDQAISLIEKTDEPLLNDFRKKYPIIYKAALATFRAALEKRVVIKD